MGICANSEQMNKPKTDNHNKLNQYYLKNCRLNANAQEEKKLEEKTMESLKQMTQI